MLKGLFDFGSINEKTLSFQRNENLLYLSGVPKNENWLRVCNLRGRIGLVPINYVDIDSEVSGSCVVDFLDESIRVAKREKCSTLLELQDVRQSILNPINDLEKRLEDFRRLIDQLKAKNSPFQPRLSNARKEVGDSRDDQCPDASETDSGEDNRTQYSDPVSYLTCNGNDMLDCNKDENRQRTQDKRQNHDRKRGKMYTASDKRYDYGGHENENGVEMDDAISIMSSATYICQKEGPKTPCPGCMPTKGHNSPNDMGQCDITFRIPTIEELVDVITQESDLPSKTAAMVAESILKLLRKPGILRLPSSLQHGDFQLPPRSAQSVTYKDEFDAMFTLLKKAQTLVRSSRPELEVLSKEGLTIHQIVSKLMELVSQCSEQAVVDCFSNENFEAIHTLVEIVGSSGCKETQVLVLQILAKIGVLSQHCVAAMSQSELPAYLANLFSGSEEPNFDLLLYGGTLLTLVFTNSVRCVVRLSENFGSKFISTLVDMIESSGQGSNESSKEKDLKQMTDLRDTCVNVVLARNLQFGPGDENLTMKVLAKRCHANVLTQRLIFFLMWDQDPLRLVNPFYSRGTDSVTKLVSEILSSVTMADLFYTNDVKVLIDIILRALHDWEPGDTRRSQYMGLVKVILRNTNYVDHKYRMEDMIKAFTTVLLEDDPLSLHDQKIIKEIYTEFPEILK